MNNRRKYRLQYRWLSREFARAKAYAEDYRSDAPIGHFFRMRVTRVLELLAHVTRGQILDVGCGPAFIGDAFKGMAFRYNGMDISWEMIGICVDRLGSEPNMRFIQGRAEELPFRDGSMDVVLCLGSFEYRLDGDEALAEIARTLVPGGLLVISMLNKKSPCRLWQNGIYWKLVNRRERIIRFFSERDRMRDSGNEHKPQKRAFAFNVYDEKELKGLLKKNGLQFQDSVYYDFNLFLSPLDKWFPKMAVRVSEYLERLCRSRLKVLGSGYILTVRKCR